MKKEINFKIKGWEDVSDEYGECPNCGSPLLRITTKGIFPVGIFPLSSKIEPKYTDYLCSKCNKIMRAKYEDLE